MKFALLISNSNLLTEKPDFVSAYEIGDVGPAGGNKAFDGNKDGNKDGDNAADAGAT